MFYDRAEEQEGALNTLTKQPGKRAQGQEDYESWIQSHMHILPHQPLYKPTWDGGLVTNIRKITVLKK